jgi:two-component system cell cycle sensor histidine kinase/response regulator CckA
MRDGGKASLRGGNDDGARPRLAERRLPGDPGHHGRERELRDAQRELARLEDALERVQRFDGIGRLAQGVAHDIGNLIAVIANSTASARQRLGDLGAPAVPDLDQIDRAARMVGDISRQLLTMGQDGEATGPVADVAAAAGDVVALLGSSLGSQVDLRLVHGGAQGACEVDVPRAQLEQVLVNLVLNARDALRDGTGTITVSVRSVAGADVGRATAQPGAAPSPPAAPAGHGPRAATVVVGAPGRLGPGRRVVLAVSDDGVGMAPDVARRAAEPLFSTKPAGDHAGLGLATVAGIAQRAGGEVRLRTAPGTGTTVTVVLPAALVPVATPS